MKKFAFTIFIFCAIASQCVAGDYRQQQRLSGGAIQVTVMNRAECEAYDQLRESGDPDRVAAPKDRGFVLKGPYALITLSAGRNSANPTNGVATVEAIVRYEYELNGMIRSGEEEIELSVSIGPAGFKDISYVKIDQALSAEVEITAVTGVSLFPDITLTAACEGAIYRLLAPGEVVEGLNYTSPPRRGDGSLADGNLYVSWTDLPAAESYELEWTYISDQGAAPGQTLSKENIRLRDGIFRRNSSRVAIAHPAYFIPLVYEKGLIVFRVRPVGKNIVDGELTDIKGEWTIQERQNTLKDVSNNYIYAFDGLENKLNWQSSISFAEEGKNKAVVSYHDGSLRNRQAVTRINTDERAIVGETYYDHNGRPVIQVLPVPARGDEETGFNFRPHFNLPEGSSVMRKSVFDPALSGSSCLPLAPQFSTTTGSSFYYSGANTFGTSGNTGQNILNKNYIPDAGGYPYTQTRYVGDNTGRIAAQSGVGQTHMLGSGHDTRYFYGVPLQAEISRLFGTQVGMGGFYKKNSVIDPNGQMSVSYLDLSGKVIATALAGGNATNLDNLPGNNERAISSNLITSASNLPDSDGRGKTMIYPLTVTTSVDYSFDYTLSAGVYAVSCTGSNEATIELKMAGVLDASLTLYDECSVPVFSESVSLDDDFGPEVTGGSKNINKVVPAQDLPAGQYRLVKSVRINQEKLDDYLEEYFSNDTYVCVLADEDFLAAAYDSVDFSGCDLTCSDCHDRIDELIAKMPVAPSAKDQALLRERCDEICLENSTCISGLYNMLATVSPDGQYGQVRPSNPALDNATSLNTESQPENLNMDGKDFAVGTDDSGDPSLSMDNSVVPERFPLSIFNDDNTLVVNRFLRTGGNGFFRASWRRPIIVSVSGASDPTNKNQVIFSRDLTAATYAEGDYYNENGELAYAYVQVDGDNYLPRVVPGAEVIPAESVTEPMLYKVRLKYLADVRDFLKHWQAHFANYLVPYHPEFAYYVECTGRAAINAYEEKMIDMNELAADDSVRLQFLRKEMDGGVMYLLPDVLAKDPIFTDTKIPADLRGDLAAKVTNYRVIYDEQGVPVTPRAYYSLAQYSTIVAGCPNPFMAACRKPDCESGRYLETDDDAWMAFKSLYLTERQRILREASTREAIEGRYYNGCIGNTTFNGSAEQRRMKTMYKNPPSFVDMKNARELVCDVQNITPQYGRQWFSYCWYTHPVNYGRRDLILRQFHSIPAFDPEQTCQALRAPDYSKKIRAFYPPLPGATYADGVEPSNATCYEIVEDNNGKAAFYPTACNMGLAEQGVLIENAATVRSYSACGNCPRVTQIKELLDDLIEAESLEGEVERFNCHTSPTQFGLGKELRADINQNIINSALFSWDGNYSTGTGKLDGLITSEPQTGNNKLRLELDFSGSGIPAMASAVDASKLFKLARVASITTDHLSPAGFILKMYINLSRSIPAQYAVINSLLPLESERYNPSRNQAVYRYEFDVPGKLYVIDEEETSVKADLSSCDLPALCGLSRYPREALFFLNTLAYEDTSTGEEEEEADPLKTRDLVRDSAPLPVEDSDIYEESVRGLLHLKETDAEGNYLNRIAPLGIEWSSAVSGSVLSGSLSYEESSVSRRLDIKVTPYDEYDWKDSEFSYTLDFDDIQYFTNLLPYGGPDCATGICTSSKFYADAVIRGEVDDDTNALIFYRVVIELKTYTGGVADSVQPVASHCEKTVVPGNNEE